MKAVVIGMVAAVLLATATAFVLDAGLQQGVAERYATSGVRL